MSDDRIVEAGLDDIIIIEAAYGPGGMVLRDWFAGQALVGMVADVGLNKDDIQELATVCYGMADALLEARKR